MFTDPKEYALQLISFCGNDQGVVPLTALIDGAKRWSHVPSIFWVDAAHALRLLGKLDELS